MAKKEIFNDLNLVIRLNQHIDELTSNPAAAEVLREHESSFQVLAELSSITNPEPRADAQFEHQQAQFVAADYSDLPFHLQGDQTFNEANAMAKRRALRRSPAIRDRVLFLWHVASGRKKAMLTAALSSSASASASSSTPDARGNDGGHSGALADSDGSIGQQEYTDMMLLVFKVLREDFVLSAATTQIHYDWDVDSHHGELLSFEEFFAAFFELVDVWTCDILETTYVRFLDLLARRITIRVVVFLDDRKLKLALSDNFDDAVVVKAIPLTTITKFAPVAKLMEQKGVETVGELASADPGEVERHRLAYLRQNACSHDKIGGELSNLLRMFQQLSEQFGHTEYSFQDMVLQRRATRTESNMDTVMNVMNAAAGSTGALGGAGGVGGYGGYGELGGDASRASGDSDGGMPSRAFLSGTEAYAQGGDVDEVYRGSSGSPLKHTTDTGDAPEVGGLGRRGGAAGRSSGRPQGNRAKRHEQGGSVNGGTIGSDHGSDGESDGGGSGSGASGGGAGVRRGMRRINTFHDLSTTDTGVIDALKTSFLIEKGISIQRKADAGEIDDELRKFGVNVEALASREEKDAKYASLYEMFVLRDGDNIRALAQSILQRIKMELAAHGIIVNDADAEAMYDDFYTSIVTGSGHGIVTEAQSWVQDTVATNSMGSYIKQDYHELQSINEVKLLGSQVGDDEFISLLATEGEDESKVNQSESDQSQFQRRGNGEMVLLSRRPSLIRAGDGSPRAKMDGSDETGASPSKSPNDNGPLGSGRTTKEVMAPGSESKLTALAPSSKPSPRSPPNAHDSSSKEKGPYAPRSTKKTDKGRGSGIHTARTSGTEGNADKVADNNHEEDANPKSDLNNREDDSSGVDANLGMLEEHNGTTSEEVSLAMGTEEDHMDVIEKQQHDGHDDDEESRKKDLSLPSRQTDHDLHGSGDPVEVDELHTALNEMDGDFQRIEYVYEEEQPHVVKPATPPPPSRPICMAPKVPDIVIGGVDSGRSVPVTARYIQLLGLGSVTTITPESELLDALRSTRRGTTDLLLFDVGNELDQAVARTQRLCALLGNRVILFGGDETDPDKTRTIGEECVTHGALSFTSVPLQFPKLRSAILAALEQSPQPFILHTRRSTAFGGGGGGFGAGARISVTPIRTDEMLNGNDSNEMVARKPASPAAYAAVRGRRKATGAISLPHVAGSSSSPSPAAVMGHREHAHGQGRPTPASPAAASSLISYSRPTMAPMDDMAAVETRIASYVPMVPQGGRHGAAHRKSPRISATLKKLMR